MYNRVTVCDFGLSRVLATDEDIGVGTERELLPICWMSPETLRGRIYSEKTDVYSFGLFLYEMIARSQPYPGLNPIEVVAPGVSRMDSPLRPIVPNSCPREWGDLITECWSAQPDKRPTMKQVNQRLTGFLDKYDSGSYVYTPIGHEKDPEVAETVTEHAYCVYQASNSNAK